MDHGFYCFHDGSILYLCHSILLRIIGCCDLPLNPSFFIGIIEFIWCEFSSIVWSQGLDLLFREILYKGLELFELSKYLFFTLQEVNPSLAVIVINKGNIVNIPTYISSFHRKTYIWVNNVQDPFRFTSVAWKWILGILSLCTSLVNSFMSDLNLW